ncbi:acyltransferase [Luteimonas sp. RIT-PG2_3]
MALEIILRFLVHPRLRAKFLAALGARVGRNVRVYECHFVNLRSGFENLRIGDDVHIGAGCMIDLEGPVSIGSGSVLSPRVTLLSHTDPGSAHGSPMCERWKPDALGISIGEGCWIGACATLLSGAVVGDRVVVGASALVRGSLRSDGTYVGVPARPIRS